MIFKVTRYRTYFLEAESHEQAQVLCNLNRFELTGFADFPGRPFEYEEGSKVEPYTPTSKGVE